MKRTWIAALLLTAASPGVFAAKVYVDYDKDAKHHAYETWSYVDNAEGRSRDPLMHDRLVEGLRHMLSKSKLREVETGGDLNVTYTVTTKDRTQYSTVTTGFGYGYPGGWGGYGGYGYYGGSVGIGSSTTYETTYTDGTIIIDAWDPQTNSLVWRGSATETLKAKPEKIAKQIEKMYAQLWSRWEKIRANAAKAQ